MNVLTHIVPDELQELNQWVVWRFETRDGKATKVPYRADGAGRASSTDPASWASFNQAIAATRGSRVAADGVGFVFTPDDPFCGVDLDAGLPEADRQAVVSFLESYTETSVSGSGLHVIVRASLNGRRRNRKGPVEVYDQGRYFVVTGEHVPGTPATVELRQWQLEQILDHYLPEPDPAQFAQTPARPVELADRDLLDAMFAARNGARIEALWRGDTSAYGGDDSAADQALCNHLAFYTGRDAARMDAMFRASGLMRPKWERADYRERTIASAIAATGDVYTPPRQGASQVRPVGDAPSGSGVENTPEEAEESAVRPRVPPVKGTRDGTHLPSGSGAAVEEPSIHVVEAAAFAAVKEASAEPLLGDSDGTVLAAGGTLAFYGDGGAGKTTVGLDQAFHLCAGVNWLGLHVPRACVVLWIENEGPRGKFREKLRAKIDAWDGPKLGGRLHVLERPWSLFTFGAAPHRAELAEVIRTLDVDVVIAGPVQRLGIEGGGTPAEIQGFVDLLELVRAELERPLAFELIHHENKAGDVSGAWEGATDTLAHIQARGNGHTAIVWRKVRWHSSLHGNTWKLDWRDGERFERDDTPETTDDAIADQLLALVRESPGGSWNAYDELVTGKAKRKRAVRDQLLEEQQLVNTGTAKAMSLYLPAQTDETQLDLEEPTA